MAIVVEDGCGVGKDGVTAVVVEVGEALHGAAHEADDVAEAVSQAGIGVEGVEGLGCGGHGKGFALEVAGGGAVTGGNDDGVFHIGPVLNDAAGGDVFGIEREAAPGTVDIAGGQLIVDFFLFDDLGFERPAEELGDGNGQLDIEAPEGAVGGVDQGEGVGINANDEGFILRDGKVIQGGGIFFKGDGRGCAEPLAGQLIYPALSSKDLDGSNHIVDEGIVIAKGHGILLLHKGLHGFDTVARVAAAGGEREEEQECEKG